MQVSFLDLFDVWNHNDLQIQSRRQEFRGLQSLAAPIGKTSDNQTYFFDIHEKKLMGHLMINGSIGSGKTELLKTWLLSMAVSYHPNSISFFAVDCKNELSQSVSEIPHTIFCAKNGDEIESLINRIINEMRVRQMILSRGGYNHISSYQKSFYEGNENKPMPRLILAVDNLENIVHIYPPFIKRVAALLTVGRALGFRFVFTTSMPYNKIDMYLKNVSQAHIFLGKEYSWNMDIMDETIVPGRAALFIAQDFEQYFQCAYSHSDETNMVLDCLKKSTNIDAGNNLLWSNTDS